MADLHDTVCIFDLDGTLIDSAPDLSAALNRILAEEGLAAISLDRVRPMVGEGARALLRLGYAHHGRPEPDGDTLENLTQRYIETYRARISEHSFVFENVTAALERLRGDGAVLAVCTNKTENLALPLLRDLGLIDFFEVVVGADTTAERKPSALPIQHIFREIGRSRGLMIGDTFTDFAAAEAAKIPALIATFGYGNQDPRLSTANRFENFAELPEKVSHLLG